jgi:hypothetical protein
MECPRSSGSSTEVETEHTLLLRRIEICFSAGEIPKDNFGGIQMNIICGFFKTKRAAQIEKKRKERNGHTKYRIEEARKPKCDAEYNVTYINGYTLIQTAYYPNTTR